MRPGLAPLEKATLLYLASNFSRSQQIRELPIGLAVLPASLHRDGADAWLRFPATVIFDLTFAPVVFSSRSLAIPRARKIDANGYGA